MHLLLNPQATVEAVLEEIIDTAFPPQTSIMGFELRMVEDDDTPDLDIPALEKSRHIGNFGIDTVALCRKENVREIFDPRSSLTYLNSKKKQVMKINLDNNSSFLLPIEEGMLLCDLLAKVATKTQKVMLMDSYEFHLVHDADNELSMATLVEDIEAEELNLITKQKLELRRNHEIEDVEVLARMCQYTEYMVLKTNKHGIKQERLLGLDQNFLYNKKSSTGLFSKLTNVKSESWPMSSVVEAKLINGFPCTFQVLLHEDDTNSIRIIDYETKFKEEASLIVEKIMYILSKKLYVSGHV